MLFIKSRGSKNFKTIIVFPRVYKLVHFYSDCKKYFLRYLYSNIDNKYIFMIL